MINIDEYYIVPNVQVWFVSFLILFYFSDEFLSRLFMIFYVHSYTNVNALKCTFIKRIILWETIIYQKKVKWLDI